MFDAIASTLSFFYDIWPLQQGRYGMAIVLLTALVLLIVTPLTFKSTKSMLAMQRLQPQIKKLQGAHRDDRQKLNEEMMALYQRHGVNPMAGCFPMLIQIPVFLVLYRVITGLTRRSSDLGEALGVRSVFEALAQQSSAVGGQLEFPAPRYEIRNFNPQYLDHDSELFRDLSATNKMLSFGLDLGESAKDMLSQSFVDGVPYLILIGLVALTAWVQQRQIMGRNPDAARNPQQQMIMRIMPIFVPVISFGLPAAVVLYFVVSNLFRLGQQTIITHRFYGENRPAPLEEELPEPEIDKDEVQSDQLDKKKGRDGKSASRHGTRRPTSTAAARSRRSQRAGRPAAKRTGPKPTKPGAAKSGGRVTPKKNAPEDKTKGK